MWKFALAFLITLAIVGKTMVSAVNVSVTIPSHGVIIYEPADLNRPRQEVPEPPDGKQNSGAVRVALKPRVSGRAFYAVQLCFFRSSTTSGKSIPSAFTFSRVGTPFVFHPRLL